MATQTPRTRAPRAGAVPALTDPDGGQGDIHDQLIAAVDETARLLDADGAMVYLVDAETGHLRFAHDAGIRSRRSRRWVRSIELPVGTGLFGRAVAERGVVMTRDYLADRSIAHAPETDRVVEDIGIRSMVAAPLVHGDTVFGALGAFSTRPSAFSDSQVALVRALADHAAAAMTNARLMTETTRLIDELDRSRDALKRRAEAEQGLRELAARITAMREPAEILNAVVVQAGRLVRADGAILDLLDPTTGNLHWAYDDGLGARFSQDERDQLWISVGIGATGTAVAEDRVIVAGDDLASQFPPSPESTAFYERTGFRSMIAAPITGDAGPLGVIEVYSKRRDAFTETDASLVGALAGQAAIAITNARLIDELAHSRSDLAQTADAERTLREIAARVSAMRDQKEILQSVIDEAARLLRAIGVTIDLIGAEGMAEAWPDPSISPPPLPTERAAIASVKVDADIGISGLAIRTRAAVWTSDYLVDDRFPHTDDRDGFVRETGIRSVVAVPLIHRDEVLGVINAFSDRVDAFDRSHADLLVALADQAAVTIANAKLIEELERSRAEIARRADSERTLREIAARVSAILDPAEVLQRIVDEAARLLDSDGARIDQYDPGIDALRWSYAAGDAMSVVPDWAVAGGLKPGQAVAGLAFAEQRPILTVDYLADERFDHVETIDAFIRDMGIRAVMSTPLSGTSGPIGTISVVSRSPGAYDEADLEVLTALATQASIAIRNANLMAELAASRDVIERRAEAEHALREIAARITAIREPGDLLQHVVDEAHRLLRADGAMIDQFDPETGTLEWAYDAGLPEAQRSAVRLTSLHIGEGVAGKAIAENRVVAIGDYMAADFDHDDLADSLALGAGIRDLIAAPIIGEAGPLGAIEVFSHEPHAFDDIDAAVLGGLADQAAIAITNARLIEELERSRLAVARRADTERSLRDITARIAALREPDVILKGVVEEAKRLLATDGAHLTRISEDGTYLVPVVVSGGMDEELERWLMDMRFPIGGGINGLAAERGEPIATFDYIADDRIPHEGNDDEVAARMGLRGMAAAPLRAPGGEVIGTLAISASTPRAFQPEELDLLQGLADQAAIAITNSTLLTKLTQSEERYRFLVENSPDVVFATDVDGRFTFVSEGIEAMTGWTPDEVVGQPYGSLVEPDSLPTAADRWARLVADPTTQQVSELVLLGKDGRRTQVEVHANAIVGPDGAFAGIHGSTRDIGERERLQRELRGSEERYRYLVSSSPDLVWVTDADGRLTFVSEASRSMLGLGVDELIGRPYADVFEPASRREVDVLFRWLARHPTQVQRSRQPFRHADGHVVMVEISGIGMVEDGRFVGAHGAARDVSDRDRLEKDLRRQAGELAAGEERAHLARELHDSVTQALFSMTLVSRSVELLLDRDADAARVQLTQLRDLQREALAEMRALIFELRPGNLEQDGLTHALKTHTAALQGRIGLPVVVESTLAGRLPLPVEEALYRIAQEALHNVVKHAAAQQVRVEVGPVRNGVRMRIVDDGRGFDPRQVPAGHLGLAGMEARATRIGATFTCTSRPGKGTTIEILVPAEIAGSVPAGSPRPTAEAASSIRDR